SRRRGRRGGGAHLFARRFGPSLLLLYLFLALPFAPLGVLTGTLLGNAARVFLGFLPRLLLFGTAAVLALEALALAALVFDTLALAPRRLLGLAALLVDLVLLLARLFLEDIPLDIGTLTAHLDVDGACTSLCAGQLELALRLAAQCDLARRGITAVTASVAAPQVREQLQLGIVADARIRPVDLDSGLIELHQQPIHGDLQHLSKLGNRYFCHRWILCLPQWPVSNQGARAVMISLPASSAARPSMSERSSTDCSARSSRVRTPRRASARARSGLIP